MQRDQCINMQVLSIARRVRLNVAEVTNMFLNRVGSGVGHAIWVVVRASRRTPFNKVAILVNMESMLMIWCQILEGACDCCRAVAALLFEVSNTSSSFSWL